MASLLLSPALVQAADAAAPASEGARLNVALIGLVSVMLILLLIIGLLGNVLRQLAFAYRDKMREERSRSNAGKVLSILFVVCATAMQAFAQEAPIAEIAAPAPQIISGISNNDFYIMIGMLAFEIAVLISLILLIRTMVKLMAARPELAPALKEIKLPFWDRLNSAVAVEKEQDIMLDHDYDGIKELDNSLPPWWKYGFYLTIIVSFVYMWYYHAGGSGPSSLDEYAAEVKKGEIEKAAYLAKSANNVDENTVTMGDAASIAAGEGLFQASCAACHAKDGGGGVGPNLTDEYWLHGGSIKDVFKSIKYGWADKGMKSWKDDFSPKQIADISTYIRSLKGSSPAAPKEKQGELYTEGTEATGTDSTKAVAVK